MASSDRLFACFGRATAAACLVAFGAAVASSAPAASADEEETWSLDTTDTPIYDLIDGVAEVMGHTYVVHPDVQGEVTIADAADLDRDAVFEVFVDTMSAHGYEVVAAGFERSFRIIPAGDADAEVIASDARAEDPETDNQAAPSAPDQSEME